MKRIILALTLLVFCCFSCESNLNENDHTTIKVTNLTDGKIYVGSNWVWPDDPDGNTKLTFSGKGEVPPDHTILPGETNSEAFQLKPVGKASYEGALVNNTMIRIFFVCGESLDKVRQGESSIDDVIYESRLYTYADLSDINFHIVYK